MCLFALHEVVQLTNPRYIQGSGPLPALPSSSTIQGSPRSKDLGGSLGPAFVITVGDPQTVGKNPASQHTVFTVRTRVSFLVSAF